MFHEANAPRDEGRLGKCKGTSICPHMCSRITVFFDSECWLYLCTCEPWVCNVHASPPDLWSSRGLVGKDQPLGDIYGVLAFAREFERLLCLSNAEKKDTKAMSTAGFPDRVLRFQTC